MDLVENTEFTYTPDVDTNLQVQGKGLVYLTKDNTKPKSKWQTIELHDRVLIPAGSTYYFFCSYDNILAEIAV